MVFLSVGVAINLFKIFAFCLFLFIIALIFFVYIYSDEYIFLSSLWILILSSEIKVPSVSTICIIPFISDILYLYFALLILIYSFKIDIILSVSTSFLEVISPSVTCIVTFSVLYILVIIPPSASLSEIPSTITKITFFGSIMLHLLLVLTL